MSLAGFCLPGFSFAIIFLIGKFDAAMLKIEHLTKVYPNGTQALKDVSFEVKDGAFMAVIGLSGSGKSTLLRCINRLIEPTSGKIYWDDVDITALSQSDMRKYRRQMGM